MRYNGVVVPRDIISFRFVREQVVNEFGGFGGARALGDVWFTPSNNSPAVQHSEID